jgi:hypothetical protein
MGYQRYRFNADNNAAYEYIPSDRPEWPQARLLPPAAAGTYRGWA